MSGSGALLRLLRFPGVLVSVAFAGLILGIAVSSSPLFLSSSASAALDQAIGPSSVRFAGLSVEINGPAAADAFAFRHRVLTEATGGTRVLGKPQVTVVGSVADVCAGSCNDPRPVRMVSRTAFSAHVEAMAPARPGGVWLDHLTAGGLGVGPGDTVTVRLDDLQTEVAVGGIYRDLYSAPEASGFWRPLYRFIYGQGGIDRPPPLLLADHSVMLPLQEALQDRPIYRWAFPLARGRMSISEANAAAEELRGVESSLSNSSTQVGGTFAGALATVGLPSLVDSANLTVVSMKGPVTAMSVAGWLLATVLMGLAGLFGVRRRRVEISVLTARGVAPWKVGVTSAAESVLPAAASAALGWAAGAVVVSSLGPSTLIESGALRAGLQRAGWSVVVGVVVLAVVTALGSRRVREGLSPVRQRGGRGSPWEAVPLVLAGAAYYEITVRGAPVVVSGGEPRVDLLLFLFPLLAVVTLAGLAARALRRLLPLLRVVGNRWSPPAYLAIRRLAGSGGTVVALVGCSVIALGMLAYAGILVSSVQATGWTKARLSLGSDVAVTLPADAPALPELGVPATRVFRAEGRAETVPGHLGVDLLGIDPETFAGAAFWDEGLADEDLETMLRGLGEGSVGGRLPAITVGGTVGTDAQLQLGGARFPLRLVGRASSFPGLASGAPALVVDSETLEEAFAEAGVPMGGSGITEEAWLLGEAGQVQRSLAEAELRTERVALAERVWATPAFLALTWTFGFLEALGILAGLIVIVGLLLYLQARERAREVSYALAARMGLGRKQHRRSVVMEVGAMLGAGLAVALAGAFFAAWLVHEKLDPLPGLPSDPVLRFPWPMLGGVVVALLVVAVGAGWAAQRRAERADIAEAMRLAT